MKTITRTEARNIIKQQGSKVFGVTFTKANGELRKMSCSTKVKKDLKGGVSTIAHKPDLIGVYDMNNGRRCFSIDRLLELKANGQVYKVEG